MIRILAVGDVMGRGGRKALTFGLEIVRQEWQPDFVLINGENVAGGFGITSKIFEELIGRLGIDCITMGNHWMDKKDVYQFRDHPKLVLPANMSNVADPAKGIRTFEIKGRPLAVFNLLGKTFMKGENASPFDYIDRMMDQVPSYYKIKILDIHAEATSEKQGLGQYLAGRFSIVYGTHSHVPTADERILKNHTGFVTDLGLCGAYDSVIGIETKAALLRLRTGDKKGFEPASDNLWFYGMIFDVSEDTGACEAVHRLRFPIKDS